MSVVVTMPTNFPPSSTTGRQPTRLPRRRFAALLSVSSGAAVTGSSIIKPPTGPSPAPTTSRSERTPRISRPRTTTRCRIRELRIRSAACEAGTRSSTVSTSRLMNSLTRMGAALPVRRRRTESNRDAGAALRGARVRGGFLPAPAGIPASRPRGHRDQHPRRPPLEEGPGGRVGGGPGRQHVVHEEHREAANGVRPGDPDGAPRRAKPLAPGEGGLRRRVAGAHERALRDREPEPRRDLGGEQRRRVEAAPPPRGPRRRKRHHDGNLRDRPPAAEPIRDQLAEGPGPVAQPRVLHPDDQPSQRVPVAARRADRLEPGPEPPAVLAAAGRSAGAEGRRAPRAERISVPEQREPRPAEPAEPA